LFFFETGIAGDGFFLASVLREAYVLLTYFPEKTLCSAIAELIALTFLGEAK
jgi:hypothetical protein